MGKRIDLDDFCPDRIRNTVSYTDTIDSCRYYEIQDSEVNSRPVASLRSSKLHDRSQDQGLPEFDRTRRNRRRPRVSGIIGTDIPGI